MNYRTISTKYLKTTTEQELKVEVYYSKGGANYLAGGIIQRGYWLSVQPVSRSVSNGLRSESFTLGSGLKYFLKETRADRREGKAEREAVKLAADRERLLIKEVCLREKLELAA